MCYQSSSSFSVIWDRGDAHLSHSSLNPELSQFTVLKLIWPSSGTLQHHYQLTPADTSHANICGRNFECASLIGYEHFLFQRGALFGSLRGAFSELGAAVSICGGLPASEQK